MVTKEKYQSIYGLSAADGVGYPEVAPHGVHLGLVHKFSFVHTLASTRSFFRLISIFGLHVIG